MSEPDRDDEGAETDPPFTDKPPDEVEDPFAAARSLVESRAVDGILRRLQAQFADLDPADVEDAVYTAFERLAKRAGGVPDNPRAWVLTVARNLLVDLRRRKPVDPLDDADDLVLGTTRSAEDEALDDETYRLTCAHIHQTWTSARSKTVVLLVLEAAHFDEPISNEDLAHQSTDILGEEITTENAATLKSRGLRRLRVEYPTIFGDPPGASS